METQPNSPMQKHYRLQLQIERLYRQNSGIGFTSNSQKTTKFKQSGLTVAVTSPVIKGNTVGRDVDKVIQEIQGKGLSLVRSPVKDCGTFENCQNLDVGSQVNPLIKQIYTLHYIST